MNTGRAAIWVLALVLCGLTRAVSAEDIALTVTGADGTQQRIDQAAWAKLPRVTVRAIDHDGKEGAFEGVAVRTVLSLVKAPINKEMRGKNLTLYVVAQAADNYRALYALAEFEPDFTDRVIVIADRRDGQPLADKEGPLRIVIPGEKKQARWVRMLTNLSVRDAP